MVNPNRVAELEQTTIEQETRLTGSLERVLTLANTAELQERQTGTNERKLAQLENTLAEQQLRISEQFERATQLEDNTQEHATGPNLQNLTELENITAEQEARINANHIGVMELDNTATEQQERIISYLKTALELTNKVGEQDTKLFEVQTKITEWKNTIFRQEAPITDQLDKKWKQENANTTGSKNTKWIWEDNHQFSKSTRDKNFFKPKDDFTTWEHYSPTDKNEKTRKQRR